MERPQTQPVSSLRSLGTRRGTRTGRTSLCVGFRAENRFPQPGPPPQGVCGEIARCPAHALRDSGLAPPRVLGLSATAPEEEAEASRNPGTIVAVSAGDKENTCEECFVGWWVCYQAVWPEGRHFKDFR